MPRFRTSLTTFVLLFTMTLAVSASARRSGTHATTTKHSSTKSATAKPKSSAPSVKTARLSKAASSKAASGKASSGGASASSRSRRGRHASVQLPNSRPKQRGQQAISEDRTREIQQALIREHYLEGEPSGVMDAETRNALIRLQDENGWQTKLVPDSRALIKLGLGPNRDGLLNPDSAAVPNAPATTTP